MKNIINLTKEQQEIVDAKGNDLLVSASAGSGKTFVVVEKIINRIINDKIDIDKILVITFTNAAASELKERIVNRLYDYLKYDDISDLDKRHIKKQLSLINRAQISTIHSFCLNIIKSNFYILGIDPNIKTMDENKAKILLLECLNEILEEEYENSPDDFEKVLEVFKTEESVIDSLEDLYNFSRTMTEPEKWLEESLEKYNIGDDISDLSELDFGNNVICNIRESLQMLDNEITVICNKIAGNEEFESRLNILCKMQDDIKRMLNIQKYDELYTYINSIEFPRLPSSRCANEVLKNEVADIKKKVTNELNEIKKSIYKDTNGIKEELNSMHSILQWLIRVVINLDKLYCAKKMQMNNIDFNDYEHMALKVLEDEDVCNQYINKYEDIYIDEYQDTSHIQEEITKRISKNNRIMVGDVKQSIYSFRNAEPKLFNEKYNSYLDYSSDNNDPSKIVLSKNFRSREEVISSINDVFKRIMTNEIGECEYTNKEKLVYGQGYEDNKQADYRTEINIIETDITDSTLDDSVMQEIENIDNIQKEAYEVADKIKSLVSDGMEIYDLKNKAFKKIEYKDIVILMRSASSKAAIYENILKEKSIPVFSDTSEGFYNGEEVGIILSLLKIVDNIYDDISLVSVMYSIIGKFTLDELIYIREYDKNGYFYNSIIEAYQDEKNINTSVYCKIKNFIEFLEKVKIYLNTYSIAETLLKIYEETGIYYSLYLEELGKQKCANLDNLVEIARRFEIEEKSSVYEFINYIECMKDKKVRDSDTPKLLGEGENVVRILTIHKSKGLEYPVVFLVNSSKKYNIRDTSKDLIFDKSFGIGIDIYSNELKISYSSIIKQAIKNKIKLRTLSEEERLLYVAMTRAKEKLYIYGTVKNYNKYAEGLLSSKTEKISPVIVKECNNYLKLIMLALNNNDTNNFKINVVTSKENSKNIYSSMHMDKDIDRSINSKDIFLKLCKENDIKAKKQDYIFNKKYDNMESSNVKKKYSVTELKAGDDKEEVYSLFDNTIKLKKPKFIDDKNISSVTYGTIIHKILENIDYFNIDMERINRNIDSEFTGIENINIHNVKNKISRYLNGQLKTIIGQAKRIQKEQPFVIFDNLEDISELNLKEKTYIQGVIDLIITTKNDEVVVIDFKTDVVENESELIEKYKTQLEVYEKGINLSLDKKVNKKYIYSFYLDKLISVE